MVPDMMKVTLIANYTSLISRHHNKLAKEKELSPLSKVEFHKK